MKRFFAVVFVLTVILAICGCSKTSVDKNAEVTLTFVCGQDNICVVLTDDEAAKVTNILDGNRYDSVFSGIPSCGFDQDVSLKVGNRVFAIAGDTCNYIQDLGNLRFFAISQEDMAYIHALFEKYGGYFPWI